jgi:hypothetical protein
MDKKTVELDSLCESIYLGKTLTEAEDDENKKKDDENPFADTKDSDEDEKKDDSTDEGDKDTDAPPFGGTGDTESGDTEDDTTDTTDDGGATDDAEPPTGEGSPEDDTGPQEVAAEGNAGSCDFGIELMMLGTQVHFWHINCAKGSEHDALQQLYYALTDQADRILEAYVSRTKASVTAGSELNFDFGDLEFNKEEAIGILEDVRDEADTLAKESGDDQALCNILGDVSESLSTAIYKLSRFDSNGGV